MRQRLGLRPRPRKGARNAPPDALARSSGGCAPYPAGGANGAPPDSLVDSFRYFDFSPELGGLE
jgi:hypothetical protein